MSTTAGMGWNTGKGSAWADKTLEQVEKVDLSFPSHATIELDVAAKEAKELLLDHEEELRIPGQQHKISAGLFDSGYGGDEFR